MVIEIRIRRSHLVEDSIKSFQFISEVEKRSTVQVYFSGEEGQDAGSFESSISYSYNFFE